MYGRMLPVDERLIRKSAAAAIARSSPSPTVTISPASRRELVGNDGSSLIDSHSEAAAQ